MTTPFFPFYFFLILSFIPLFFGFFPRVLTLLLFYLSFIS
jgi:hypothetical protein